MLIFFIRQIKLDFPSHTLNSTTNYRSSMIRISIESVAPQFRILILLMLARSLRKAFQIVLDITEFAQCLAHLVTQLCGASILAS